LRASELSNLKWNEVDFQNGSLKVFGKNRREQAVPLSSKLVKELTFWKEYCLREFGQLSEFCQKVYIKALS
jgi:integrase/recombinase XerD